MKKALRACSLFFTVFALVTGCNPKESTLTPEEEGTPRFIGKWAFVMEPIPLLSLMDTFSLSLTIKQDKSYNINALQRSDKTLFNSDGTWQATSDSITLIGASCMALDTLSDQLTAIPESTCATPITLPLPQSDSLWTIKTANFTVALASLPVPKDMVAQLPLLIQTIKLKRKE